MTRHPAFWRAFWIVAAIGLLAMFTVARAAPAKPSAPPCRPVIDGVSIAGSQVTYTAGVYCPGASVVFWRLAINRSGLPWSTAAGIITTRPTVSGRCVRKGPPVTLRSVLRWTASYAGSTRSGTLRGAVTSARCSA